MAVRVKLRLNIVSQLFFPKQMEIKIFDRVCTRNSLNFASSERAVLINAGMPSGCFVWKVELRTGFLRSSDGQAESHSPAPDTHSEKKKKK